MKIDARQTLLEACVNMGVNVDAADGRTLLQEAIYRDKFEIAEKLLRLGAIPDLCGWDTEETPLCTAVTEKNERMVSLLLENGADPDAGRYEDSSTPLTKAVKTGAPHIVKLLLAAKADVHADEDAALKVAVSNGQIQAVRLLLHNGADPNSADLVSACYNDYEGIVRDLVAAGALPDHSINSDDADAYCSWYLLKRKLLGPDVESTG